MRIGAGLFLLGAAIVDFALGQPSKGIAWLGLILGGWWTITGILSITEGLEKRNLGYYRYRTGGMPGKGLSPKAQTQRSLNPEGVAYERFEAHLVSCRVCGTSDGKWVDPDSMCEEGRQLYEVWEAELDPT